MMLFDPGGVKAIKMLFLLVVIMLFSSFVAISPAVYNFPMKAIIIRTVWMDQYDVEMQIADMVVKVNMNNSMKLCIFKKRAIAWHSYTTASTKVNAQSLVTYSGWGTWAALSSCICLEGIWHSRLWLSASPRRSGWGSCRCELSGSSPWGPAPWLHLCGDKQTPTWLILSKHESPNLERRQSCRSPYWNHLFSPRAGLVSFISDLVLLTGERYKLSGTTVDPDPGNWVYTCSHLVSFARHILLLNHVINLNPPAQDTAQNPPIRTYSTPPQSNHDTILHNGLRAKEFHKHSHGMGTLKMQYFADMIFSCYETG